MLQCLIIISCANLFTAWQYDIKADNLCENMSFGFPDEFLYCQFFFSAFLFCQFLLNFYQSNLYENII